jgi:hypothetical protein
MPPDGFPATPSNSLPRTGQGISDCRMHGPTQPQRTPDPAADLLAKPSFAGGVANAPLGAKTRPDSHCDAEPVATPRRDRRPRAASVLSRTMRSPVSVPRRPRDRRSVGPAVEAFYVNRHRSSSPNRFKQPTAPGSLEQSAAAGRNCRRHSTRRMRLRWPRPRRVELRSRRKQRVAPRASKPFDSPRFASVE